MKDTNLTHYGILGMHWGHRKLRTGGGLTPNTRKKNNAHNEKLAAAKAEKLARQSDDHKRKVELKKKPIPELTNQELKVLNERLQLERTYKDLKKNDLTRGQKFVRDIMTDVAKETLKTSMKGAIKGAMA